MRSAYTAGILLFLLATPGFGQSTGAIGSTSPGNASSSLRGGTGLPAVPNNTLPPMTTPAPFFGATPGISSGIGSGAPFVGTTPSLAPTTPSPLFSTPAPSTSSPSFITETAPPGSASSGQSFGGVRVCPPGMIIC